MRTVLLADLVTVARTLAALPGQERAACLGRLVEQAHSAHKVSKRLGHSHPAWGDGSLGSAASGLPRRREPLGLDADFLDALGLIALMLACRARKRSDKHPLSLSQTSTMC